MTRKDARSLQLVTSFLAEPGTSSQISRELKGLEGESEMEKLRWSEIREGQVYPESRRKILWKLRETPKTP